MLSLLASWSKNTVYIEVIRDGVVIEMRSIKDIPADIYNTHIVEELRSQAKAMGAEFEEVENEKD